jgi:tetratricopeptide (TPR) repeat protein
MWLALGLALAFVIPAHAADAPSVTPAPAADAAAPSPQTATAIAIMQVDAALQGNDCAKALPLLAQLWDDPAIQAQDPKLAEKYRINRIICTVQQQDVKAALVLSQQSLTHPGTAVVSYDLHAYLLLMDERPDEAAATLDQALTRFPDDVARLTDETVIGTLMALQQKNPGVTPPLLDHLEKAHWQVDNVVMRLSVDYMRLEGLSAAVDRHDRALADLYRADLANNAITYIISQGDGRLSDPAMASWPVKPVIRKQITEVGTYVAAHPNELFAVEYLLTLEHMNEDDGAALVQLSTIFSLLDANGLDKFSNPEVLPSLFVQRATMLAEAGRVDTALETYKSAAARMSGADLFDFNMSYMNFLIDIGHDKDALALESRIDLVALSASQRVQLAAAQACAYAYMGDTARYNAALSLTKGRDGIGDMQPYLCAGDLDNAAKAMIRQINDPAQRDSVITQAQVALPGIPISPRSKAYYTALAAVKKRPDVQAALKAQNITVRSWLLRF